MIPTNIKGKVPVLMMLGRPSLPAPAQPSIEDLDKINMAFKEMMIKSNPEMKAIYDKYPAYQPITRIAPVSYTHLDVYKRQYLFYAEIDNP